MGIVGRWLTALFARATRQTALDALYAEAVTLVRQGRREDAIERFQRALRLDPTNLIILNELACELLALGRTNDGHRLLDRAVALDDSFAPAVINLATVLSTSAQQIGRARALARRASRLAPTDGRIDAIWTQIHLKSGHQREASRTSLKAWLKSFDDEELGNSHLFAVSNSPDNSDETIAAEHMFWGATLRSAPTRGPCPIHPRGASRKVRIGYLSGDLRQHSVAHFIAPVLQAHDSDTFEIFLYHTSRTHDLITDRLIQYAQAFRLLAGKSRAEMQDAVFGDKLDVLVDLSGHTTNSGLHLFDRRLATIHVSAFGYPPTTGSRSIDYKIVDPRLAPHGDERFYSERLLRLPGSFWTFDPLWPTPEPTPPPVLQRGHLTLGYYGSVAKVSGNALRAWARILRALPDSRLAVKSVMFLDPECKQQFLTRALAEGIEPQVLDLLQPDGSAELFAAYQHVDIILDSYPYTGGTTTCFALWMGVPVITLAGRSSITRMGASMLTQLGEGSLAAGSWDEYVQNAIDLGRDTDRLSKLRTDLRHRMKACSLGNASQFMQEYEAALRSALDDTEGVACVDHSGTFRLSTAELARRCKELVANGQFAAAHRVLDYAREDGTDSPELSLAEATLARAQGNTQAATAILERALTAAPANINEPIRVELAESQLQLGQFVRAFDTINSTVFEALSNEAALRADLVRRAAAIMSTSSTSIEGRADLPAEISVVVHCINDLQFEHIASNLRSVLGPEIELRRSRAKHKASGIAQAVASCRHDRVLLIHKDCRLVSRRGLLIALDRMADAELIGPTGATSIKGFHWSGLPSSNLVGARVWRTPDESKSDYELVVYGGLGRRTVADARILGDDLMLFRKPLMEEFHLDSEFEGPHSLMEMEWTARVARSGKGVSVVPALACVRAEQDNEDRQRWAYAAALDEVERPFCQALGIAAFDEILPPTARLRSDLITLDHLIPLIFNPNDFHEPDQRARISA